MVFQSWSYMVDEGKCDFVSRGNEKTLLSLLPRPWLVIQYEFYRPVGKTWRLLKRVHSSPEPDVHELCVFTNTDIRKRTGPMIAGKFIG